MFHPFGGRFSQRIRLQKESTNRLQYTKTAPPDALDVRRGPALAALSVLVGAGAAAAAGL